MNRNFRDGAHSRKRLHEFVVSRGVILLAAAMLSPFSAHAAPQWCGGTLSNLYIDAGGTVSSVVSWRGDYVAFCNINQSAGAVSPTTCIAWLSMMRSAVQRGAQTITYYSEAPSCNAISTYGAAPVPGYFMLQN